MKKFFSFLMVAVLLCGAVQARSWRINSNPDAKPNFESINAAMESLEVAAGDTLYLDPGCQLSGQTISKRVTIIGTGYHLKEGTGESMLLGTTYIHADSVKVEGCNLGYISLGGSDITIERCKNTGGTGFKYGADVKNLKLLSCYLVAASAGTGDQVGPTNTNFSPGSGWIIEGCIIINLKIHRLTAATIANNVLIYDARSTSSLSYYAIEDVSNSTIANNIILNTDPGYGTNDEQEPYYYKNYTIRDVAPANNNTITHNVLSTEAAHAFANHPDNKFIGAVPEDIFVLEGAEDAHYQIKEGSAADGYGTNGYECGAFSGQYPYVLSGRPRFIPYIYEAVIPNQPTDGKLNVTLKIRTQNE